MKFLRNLLGSSSTEINSPRQTGRRRLKIDHLEDRRLMAVVAVFDDAAYVDTGNTSNSESDNLQASLAAAGHTVNPFSGITSADFSTGLSGASVLAIPELENGDLAASLSLSARTVIQNFVSGGGKLLVNGDGASFSSNLLNSVFGYSLGTSQSAGTSTISIGAAAGTPFANGPSLLSGNNLTVGIANSSFPAAAKMIYSDGPKATVAQITAGSGQVIFLGWDWFNAAPVGAQDGGWLSVLSSATAGPATFNFAGGSNLTLRRNGSNYEIVDNNTSTVVHSRPLAGTSEITINGAAAVNDTLLIDYSFGGFFDRRVTFNGGAGGNDALRVHGASFTNVVHTSLSPNSGTISYDGTLVTFTGLEPVNDTTTAVNYTFNATATGEFINVVDGPIVLGSQTTQINSGSATFELVNFANKTNVTINALAGADTVTLNNPTPAAGLVTLRIDSGATAGDIVNVQATASSVSTTLTSSADQDTVNVGNAGSVQAILGPLFVENPASITDLFIDDSADPIGRTVTVSNADVTGLAPGAINYVANGIGTLTINGGIGNNTFQVNNTQGGVGTNVTTINGGAGNDIFNIAGSGLAIGSTNNFNGQAGNDTFNVSAPWAVSATLNLDGGAHAAGDTLNITGTGLTSVIYTATAVDAGTLTYDGALVTFTTLETVTDTSTATNFTLNGTTLNDTFNLVNGPLVGAVQTLGINSGLTTFGTVNVGNKTNVIVSGQSRPDTFNLNATVAVTGLATIALNGEDATNIGDDSASDLFNINATRSGVTTTMNGGGGDDTANLSPTAKFLDNLPGPTTFNGQAGNDALNIFDDANTFGANYSLTNTTFSRPLAGVVTYNTTEVLAITGGSGTSTWGVTSTLAGLNNSTTITAGAGADTFNITGSGLGAQSTNNFNSDGGNDTFNVSPPPAVTAIMNLDGGAQTTSDVLNVSGGGTFTTSVHTASGPGAGNITYDTASLGFAGLELVNDLTAATNFTFNGTAGADTINIIDGPVISTKQTMQINSNNTGGFTTVNYAARNTLTVNGQNGGDTINYNPNVSLTGYTSASLNGEDASNTADDAAGDTINLERTKAGMTTSVSGGAGADTINITPTSQNLVNIQGPLALNGNADSDTLNLNDQAFATNNTYTINSTTVSRAGANPINFDASIEKVAVFAGIGINQFNVTPSTTAEFFVDGNLPAPGTLNGDFLNINFTGTTGRKLTFTGPGAGMWEFTNRKTVGFNSIERFNYFPVIVMGADAHKNSQPAVQLVDAESKEFQFKFLAYEANYRNGVRVATGDLTGDGIPEIITAPGRSHTPVIKVFDITSGIELPQFAINAYAAKFIDGIDVAVGDVDGDGWNDIAVAPSRGVSEVRVFENRYDVSPLDPFSDTPLRKFNAFPTKFIGGSTIAVADMNADGKGDIIVGSGSGMRATINVFNVAANASSYTAFRQFLPFDSKFTGGVEVAVGRINGDATPDIIASAGPKGGSRVQLFDGLTKTAIGSPIIAFTTTAENKDALIRAVGLDVDKNGTVDEILVAQGPDGRAGVIKRFSTSGVPLLPSLLAYDPDFAGGYFLS